MHSLFDWFSFAPETTRAMRAQILVVLACALLAISSSAVLVKGMDGIDPLAIAAWRTLGATLLLLPFGLSEIRGLSRGDLARIVAAGIALALHFWTWFASLEHTTVLRSTLLVCTVPAFTAPLEWLVFGSAPKRTLWLGLLIALPGISLLGADSGEASVQGDALAVFAAALWAVYFLLGREVRQRVGAAATMTLVCASATVVLFAVAVASRTPLWGYDSGTGWRIAAAVAGPQLIGHQGLVYAVRWLPASTISALTLLEPVGATLLAMAVLGETPSPAALIGGVIVLFGIALATRS